jgi:hypothetical protein
VVIVTGVVAVVSTIMAATNIVPTGMIIMNAFILIGSWAGYRRCLQ